MIYKNSKQRNIIEEYLCNLHKHVSAEEIHEQINVMGHNISLATIYRNLNILVDLNIIQKLSIKDKFLYDGNPKEHYHFYCNKCQTLFDIELDYDTKIDDRFRKLNIGKVNGHTIIFDGECKNCMN